MRAPKGACWYGWNIWMQTEIHILTLLNKEAAIKTHSNALWRGTIFPYTVHKQHGTVNTSPTSLDKKMLKEVYIYLMIVSIQLLKKIAFLNKIKKWRVEKCMLHFGKKYESWMDGEYRQNQALNDPIHFTGKRVPKWNLLYLVSRFIH